MRLLIAIFMMLVASPVWSGGVMMMGGGVPVVSDPYTTYFSNNFGCSDSGDVYSCASPDAFTSETDTGSLGAISSGAYVLTYSGASTASYVAKTGLTVHNNIRSQVTVTLSTLTMGSGVTPQIMVIRNTGATIASVTIRATSTSINNLYLTYYDGAGSPHSANVNYSFQASTPYVVALRFVASTDTSTADGAYYVDINGTNQLTVTSTTTPQNMTVGRLGMNYSDASITGTITLDNYSISYQ